MTSLQATELSCSYGKHVALSDLSLKVHAGEILSLLGPNGSGKTTLLRSLARLLKPRRGKVLLEKSDIWTLRAGHVAQQMAMTPQAERRDWPIRVEHAVLLGRTPHRGWLLPYTADDRKHVDQAIKQCGLESLRDRPVTELSGGEWRRVVLARTIAQQPSILLLDEPLANLDLKYQFEFLRFIRRLAQNDKLAVVVTMHDLNVAAMFSHRVGLLKEGRLIAVGSPSEVYTAENIASAFDVDVVIDKHPVYGTPLVAPTSF